MVAKWREGFDVVYGKRRSREGETFFKLLTARWFYRLFAAMIPIEVPLDTGDFRLMSRRVVLALRELQETHRFVRGMVSWIGFKQTAVLYDRPGRFAGETKYPLRKMIRFAVDGITSFSILPLRFATYLGMLISMLSVARSPSGRSSRTSRFTRRSKGGRPRSCSSRCSRRCSS
jgi:polyisoprenyl-phosphate glycosyltransferase